MRRAPRPESVRALPKGLLVHRFQHHQHRTLEHFVLQRRYPDGPGRPSVVLRDVHAAYRRCTIAPRLEPLEQTREVRIQLRLVLGSPHPVHPARAVLARSTVRLAQPLQVHAMGRRAREPGPFLERRPRRLPVGGDVETSQVPGQTPVRARPALRPRRTDRPRPLQGDRCCLPLRKPRRLRVHFPSEAPSRGSHAPCVPFAVGVTPAPRNTRFQPVANLCRAGFQPARSAQGGFRPSASCYMSSPSPRLCLAHFPRKRGCGG
jgi:hypothetical protein